MRDSGTVDIDPDADLKALQARGHLTDKQKAVRACVRESQRKRSTHTKRNSTFSITRPSVLS